jgi:hypothetical protein
VLGAAFGLAFEPGRGDSRHRRTLWSPRGPRHCHKGQRAVALKERERCADSTGPVTASGADRPVTGANAANCAGSASRRRFTGVALVAAYPADKRLASHWRRCVRQCRCDALSATDVIAAPSQRKRGSAGCGSASRPACRRVVLASGRTVEPLPSPVVELGSGSMRSNRVDAAGRCGAVTASARPACPVVGRVVARRRAPPQSGAPTVPFRWRPSTCGNVMTQGHQVANRNVVQSGRVLGIGIRWLPKGEQFPKG